jgi:hypothetical protein
MGVRVCGLYPIVKIVVVVCVNHERKTVITSSGFETTRATGIEPHNKPTSGDLTYNFR